jgi:hypothetical protein
MTVAVLDELPSTPTQVVYLADRPRAAVLHHPIATLDDLMYVGRQLAERSYVNQLWLTVRWSERHTVARLERAWTPTDFKGEPAAIVAPALHRTLGPRLADVGGGELLATLELLRGALGVDVEGSPGHTGEMMLRGILSRRDGLDVLPESPALPSVTEPVLSWLRPLSPEELTMPWLLAVDRRAAYLQSMTLCDLGLGLPTHLERPRWRRLVWTPGYYRVTLRPWRELLLPDPIRGGRQGDEHWLTMPSLRLAEALDLVDEVTEAWVWPRRSRVLRPIADRIMAARQRIHAAAPELASIGDVLTKRMYVDLVGRLRMDARRGTPLFRPDWYASIVADARTRIFRGAVEWLYHTDRAPAAVNVDCWYILSDRPELPPGFDPKHWHLNAAVPTGDFDLDLFERGRGVSTLTRAVLAAKKAAQ